MLAAETDNTPKFLDVLPATPLPLVFAQGRDNVGKVGRTAIAQELSKVLLHEESTLRYRYRTSHRVCTSTTTRHTESAKANARISSHRDLSAPKKESRGIGLVVLVAKGITRD